MPYRHICCAIAALLLAATLSAATRPLQRGDVIVETARCLGEACVANVGPRIFTKVVTPEGETISSTDSDAGADDSVVAPDRGIYAPSPDQIFFTRWSKLLATSDFLTARVLYSLSPAEHAWMALTDIAPLRSGNLLVVLDPPARVVEITPAGALVTTYPLGPADSYTGSIELLADQCTLLHAAGMRHVGDYSRTVRRYNICTRTPEPDFAVVPRGRATSIRQLPNEDVLVATTTEVIRYSPRGEIVHIYPIPAVLIALTPDASGFWSAGEYGDETLRRIDFANPAQPFVVRGNFRNPRGLAIVGEWRASAPRARARTVKK